MDGGREKKVKPVERVSTPDETGERHRPALLCQS